MYRRHCRPWGHLISLTRFRCESKLFRGLESFEKYWFAQLCDIFASVVGAAVVNEDGSAPYVRYAIQVLQLWQCCTLGELATAAVFRCG